MEPKTALTDGHLVLLLTISEPNLDTLDLGLWWCIPTFVCHCVDPEILVSVCLAEKLAPTCMGAQSPLFLPCGAG